MYHNLKVVFWNVRGLNNPAKRAAVRTVITSAAPSIVCLQETKLSCVSPAIVMETLGASFRDFYWLAADGTRGGILLAWQAEHISLHNRTIGTFHVSATVTPTSGSDAWWITGVCGPQGDAAKLEFLDELHDLNSSIVGPWIIVATST